MSFFNFGRVVGIILPYSICLMVYYCLHARLLMLLMVNKRGVLAHQVLLENFLIMVPFSSPILFLLSLLL
jgi:hypothetical protein